MVSYPSTTAPSLDILIPTVAQYHLSGPPMLVYTSDFPRRRPYIAIAHIWTYGEKNAWHAWHPAATALELVNMAICNGMRAVDVLIGRIGIQDGCRIRLAVALAEQRGRCHVGGGNSVMDPGLLCQP